MRSANRDRDSASGHSILREITLPRARSGKEPPLNRRVELNRRVRSRAHLIAGQLGNGRSNFGTLSRALEAGTCVQTTQTTSRRRPCSQNNRCVQPRLVAGKDSDGATHRTHDSCRALPIDPLALHWGTVLCAALRLGQRQNHFWVVLP